MAKVPTNEYSFTGDICQDMFSSSFEIYFSVLFQKLTPLHVQKEHMKDIKTFIRISLWIMGYCCHTAIWSQWIEPSVPKGIFRDVCG